MSWLSSHNQSYIKKPNLNKNFRKTKTKELKKPPTSYVPQNILPLARDQILSLDSDAA